MRDIPQSMRNTGDLRFVPQTLLAKESSMKRKSKGQTIELLYTKPEETNKKTKNKKSKTNTKKTGATNSRPRKNNNTTINLDNEIIIGLTPKKSENKKQENKTKKVGVASSRSKKSNGANSKKQSKSTKKVSSATGKNKNKSKKNKIGLKIFKWTSLLVLIVATIVIFMMSSVFNIKEIVVSDNKKISSQEIINLSGLTIGTNMFKTSNSSIRNAIKTNPYIENVKIKRSISGTVKLEMEERVPTYMLKFANAYVYINNQGYMLEITETPLELPIITGFVTSAELIKEGNRLVVEDLKKLEDVIKIIESSKNNSLANMITEVNIANSSNYILTIASESKTVQFGDMKNVNVKLLKIEALIEQEKGIAGEIYFQDSEKTVFKEETKR